MLFSFSSHVDLACHRHLGWGIGWQYSSLQECLQGNCSEPFPSNITDGLGGPPLLPRKPGQCLVVLFGNGLSVVSDTAQNLWIDGLYLRQSPLEDPPDTESTVLAIDRITFGAPLQHAPSVWMSNVTLQGGGGEDVKGLSVSSRVVAEGVHHHSVLLYQYAVSAIGLHGGDVKLFKVLWVLSSAFGYPLF